MAALGVRCTGPQEPPQVETPRPLSWLGWLVRPAAAQEAVPPPKPITAEDVDRCITHIPCAATWLAGSYRGHKVLDEPRHGFAFKAESRRWIPVLRFGQQFSNTESFAVARTQWRAAAQLFQPFRTLADDDWFGHITNSAGSR